MCISTTCTVPLSSEHDREARSNDLSDVRFARQERLPRNKHMREPCSSERPRRKSKTNSGSGIKTWWKATQTRPPIVSLRPVSPMRLKRAVAVCRVPAAERWRAVRVAMAAAIVIAVAAVAVAATNARPTARIPAAAPLAAQFAASAWRAPSVARDSSRA